MNYFSTSFRKVIICISILIEFRSLLATTPNVSNKSVLRRKVASVRGRLEVPSEILSRYLEEEEAEAEEEEYYGGENVEGEDKEDENNDDAVNDQAEEYVDSGGQYDFSDMDLQEKFETFKNITMTEFDGTFTTHPRNWDKSQWGIVGGTFFAIASFFFCLFSCAKRCCCPNRQRGDSYDDDSYYSRDFS